MSALAIFSFENSQVRTLGTAEFPLFVAIDIAKALGYQNHVRSVNDHVDQEDISKVEITDNLGRKQTVNCVNESGLYALIFGSKLESAKRFKRWITSEVLPAIRRTGHYELPGDTITPTEQHTIQVAVAKRARRTASNYQTIYRAIKNRYQIARYDQLLRSQFQDCLVFIDEVDLSVPESNPAVREPDNEIRKGMYLSDAQANTLRNFVYCINYLFRDDFQMIYKLMCQFESPKRAHFYEVFNNFTAMMLENTLAQAGYSVTELDCYKYWATKNA